MQASPQNSMLLQSAQHEGPATMLTNVIGKESRLSGKAEILIFM